MIISSRLFSADNRDDRPVDSRPVLKAITFHPLPKPDDEKAAVGVGVASLALCVLDPVFTLHIEMMTPIARIHARVYDAVAHQGVFNFNAIPVAGAGVGLP